MSMSMSSSGGGGGGVGLLSRARPLRALYGTDDTYCMNGDALCSEAPLWWAWLPLLVGAWVATLVLCVARFPSFFPGEMEGMAVPLADVEPAPPQKSSKAAGKQRAK